MTTDPKQSAAEGGMQPSLSEDELRNHRRNDLPVDYVFKPSNPIEGVDLSAEFVDGLGLLSMNTQSSKRVVDVFGDSPERKGDYQTQESNRPIPVDEKPLFDQTEPYDHLL